MERLTRKDKDGCIYQPIYTATTAVFRKLALYEDTGLEPEEVESLKASIPTKGEWVVFVDDSGNKRNKCSVCENTVARNSQKSKYCPNCGAKLIEDES